MTTESHGTDDLFIVNQDTRKRPTAIVVAPIQLTKPIHSFRVICESGTTTVSVCDGTQEHRLEIEDSATVKSVEIFVDKDEPRHATIRIY